MPTIETVAKLNKIGGKSSGPSPSKFKARPSFSPEKKMKEPVASESARRSSGKLQQKRLSRAGQSSTRRHSLSPPDDDGDEAVSIPAPKPKKKAALRNKKAENPSPLKKHGFDVELPHGARVNLSDTPAKNTRSKNGNPLAALKKVNLPAPRRSAVTSRAHEEKKVAQSSSAPKTPTSNSRKRKIEDISQSDEGLRSSGRSNKRTRKEQPNIGVVGRDEDQQLDQVQEQEREDESSSIEQLEKPNDEGEHRDQESDTAVSGATKEKRPRGRPRKRKNRTTPQRKAGEIQESVQTQDRRDEEAEARRQKPEGHQERFTANVEDAIQVNDCETFWRCLGGAAYAIRDLGPNDKPATQQGIEVKRQIQKLNEVYKLAKDIPRPSPKMETQISGLIQELRDKCSLLEPTDHSRTNRDIVKDMYLRLIPAMVVLLKKCLRGRYHNRLLEENALRDLTLLIDTTISVCKTATLWTPQPSTLEDGVRLHLRNGVVANLKRLKAAYAPDLARYIRIREDREGRATMAAEAKLRHAAYKRKIESLKAERRRQVVQRTMPDPDLQWGATRNPTANEEVIDVDEIEEQLAVISRSRREPTADLPPPVPFSMSEEEQVALLNGLQQYTGENRYAEILQDPVLGLVLRTRDLDDLVKAARSFSQMMASKMGAEAYNADDSFRWLRSTNADISTGFG